VTPATPGTRTRKIRETRAAQGSLTGAEGRQAGRRGPPRRSRWAGALGRRAAPAQPDRGRSRRSPERPPPIWSTRSRGANAVNTASAPARVAEPGGVPGPGTPASPHPGPGRTTSAAPASPAPSASPTPTAAYRVQAGRRAGRQHRGLVLLGVGQRAAAGQLRGHHEFPDLARPTPGNAAAGIAGNIYQESGGNPEFRRRTAGGGLIGWTPLPGRVT